MDKKLSNKAIKSWIIGRSIGLVVFIGVFLFLKSILPKFDVKWINYVFNHHLALVDKIGLIIIFLWIISAYITPFFEYKQWSYRINEDEIYFTEGIFFKKSVTIPIVRIQNISLSEGPINSKFNLANVEIGTAGGSYEIPNLDKEEVEKIREFLKVKINENVREELDL